MATRQETQDKRRKMRDALIETCRNGGLQAGDLLPPVRDLARQYGLSVNLASEVVQSLVAEGVLHARPGAGTTVGNLIPGNAGTYLFLIPKGISREYAASGHIGRMQRGFEVTIAQLGGACLALEVEEAQQFAASGQMPRLAGILSIDMESAAGIAGAENIPHVCFDQPSGKELAVEFDIVQFDDHNGGQQATRHLLAAGHGNVAFLAMHAPHDPHVYTWSVQREAGWRDELIQAGIRCEGMAFHPLQTPSLRSQNEEPYVFGGEQMAAAREAITPLLPLIRKRTVTAVVAANLFAARTLFNVLDEEQIAPKSWPAVVCFDSFDGLDNHVVSALNLPWGDVGKAGAQLLWERNVGRLRGARVVRLVPMQLIPRLTCRSDWTEVSSLVVPHLGVSSARAETRSTLAA